MVSSRGCLLSPILFKILLEWTINNSTTRNEGIIWGLQNRLTDLDYADDICLLTNIHIGIQNLLDKLIIQQSFAKLIIIVAKTKWFEWGYGLSNNKSTSVAA